MGNKGWKARPNMRTVWSLVLQYAYIYVLLVLGYLLFVLNARQFRPSEYYDREFGADLCNCDPDVDSGQGHRASVVVLETPWQVFQSNHWYHVSQYYLTAASYLPHASISPNSSSCFVVAPNEDFVKGMTKMTFFFIILSLPFKNLEKIEILPASAVVYGRGRDVYITRHSETFVYDRSRPISERFYRSQHNGCKCGTYEYSFGRSPKMRGYWFSSGQNDILTKSHRFCRITQEETISKKKQCLVFQRDKSRFLGNIKETLNHMQVGLGVEWNVKVWNHDETSDPCKLVRELAITDSLFSVHGFAVTAMIFMKPRSLVFEIFPYRYWKPGYKPLANELQIVYGYAQQRHPQSFAQSIFPGMVPQSLCMFHTKCRHIARGFDVYASDDDVDRFIIEARKTAMKMGSLLNSSFIS